MVRAGNFNYFYGKGNENNQLGAGIFRYLKTCQQLRK
jgi:hypothetical protein